MKILNTLWVIIATPILILLFLPFMWFFFTKEEIERNLYYIYEEDEDHEA